MRNLQCSHMRGSSAHQEFADKKREGGRTGGKEGNWGKKKKRQRICIVSFQWGKYDFEWALFGESLRRVVLVNEHVLCLQKTSRKFLFRNICFDTGWWERGGVSFDSAKPGNRESGWGAVVISIYVLCIVYVFVLCIVYYVYCICPYMKCDAHDVTLL